MMTAPRFFVALDLAPGMVGETIDLPDPAAHHATRVVRLGVRDALTLFDGAGGEYAATITGIDRRGTAVRIDGYAPVEREAALSITLAQAIVANDAMDYAVRKATELGVAAVQPLVAARSAPLPAGERGDRRHAHWRQIAIAACEQCGRNRVPDVLAPQPLGAWARAWQGGGIVLAPQAQRGLAGLPAPSAPLALLIGPEGGLTAEEVAAASRSGFTAVRLGPRVLRAETAAVAALAALHALWGDFR
jgi:16S rRNA (uracil1498-N3)-methyltransferase